MFEIIQKEYDYEWDIILSDQQKHQRKNSKGAQFKSIAQYRKSMSTELKLQRKQKPLLPHRKQGMSSSTVMEQLIFYKRLTQDIENTNIL